MEMEANCNKKMAYTNKYSKEKVVEATCCKNMIL